ncbi:MAG: hypothetical protein WCA28_13375, partial [Bradyrhizobium sp.]
MAAPKKLSSVRKRGKQHRHLPIALAAGFNVWDAFRPTIRQSGRTWTDEGSEEGASPEGPKAGPVRKAQFLAAMDLEVIKSVKLVAIEYETSASEKVLDPKKGTGREMLHGQGRMQVRSTGDRLAAVG